MKFRDLIPSLTPIGWAISAGAAVVVVLILVWVFVWGPQHRAREAVEAKVGAVTATEDAKAASDVVGVVVGQGKSESEIDATTRKNDADIRGATGASNVVDPGADLAGRRALCMRHAYRSSPACKQLLDPHPR